MKFASAQNKSSGVAIISNNDNNNNNINKKVVIILIMIRTITILTNEVPYACTGYCACEGIFKSSNECDNESRSKTNPDSSNDCVFVWCKQEQLKQEVAALQKQLSSQKKQFEEEAKVREQLQEEHDKELRHLKRDIKHKQVA